MRQRAAETHNLNLLFDQEQRISPKIAAGQKKLESLAATDPLIIELAGSDDVEARWEQLSLVEKRKVIRLLVTPRIHTVGKGWRGQKGINRDRGEFRWR